MAKVKAIPAGYHTVTPSLTFKDTAKAVEFYKKAFGAEAAEVHPRPSGKGVMHATVRIGGSIVMMGDEMPGGSCPSAETLGGCPVGLYVYVPDADAAFKRAVEAGGKITMPIGDMFWGDRAGQVKDPFGYSWTIATHAKDLTKDEVRKGAEEFFASMANRR